MTIVGDVDFVIDELYRTSEAFKGLSREFIIENRDSVRLDPGGMARIEENCAEFTIKTVPFTVRWEHVHKVQRIMGIPGGEDREKIDGYVRFPQFHFNAVVPRDIYDDLKVKLSEISMMDKALSSSLFMEQARENAEKQGGFIRMDTPRDPGDPHYGLKKFI